MVYIIEICISSKFSNWFQIRKLRFHFFDVKWQPLRSYKNHGHSHQEGIFLFSVFHNVSEQSYGSFQKRRSLSSLCYANLSPHFEFFHRNQTQYTFAECLEQWAIHYWTNLKSAVIFQKYVFEEYLFELLLFMALDLRPSFQVYEKNSRNFTDWKIEKFDKLQIDAFWKFGDFKSPASGTGWSIWKLRIRRLGDWETYKLENLKLNLNWKNLNIETEKFQEKLKN